MTGHNPQQAAAVLDVLKQAVALLEQTTQTQADQSALGSEEWAQTNELAKTLVALRKFMREAAKDRPEIRAAIESLAKWIAEIVPPASSEVDSAATDQHAIPQATLQPHQDPSPETIGEPGDDESSDEPPPRRQVPLMIGDAVTVINVPGTEDEAQAAKLAAERSRNEGWSAFSAAPIAAPQPAVDVALIIERCAIKAEGCEWAARYRDVWEDDPTDNALRKATYESIVNRARALPSCYVWSLNPKVTVPGFERMTQYAQAFRNLAAAAELAHSVKREGPHGIDWLQESYMLLAEAQSAIRAALDVDGLYTDNDQEEAFRWLRQRTAEDRILVSRHMKLEDPADIAGAASLATRLSALRDRLSAARQQGSHKRSMLSKAKYHARLLRSEQSIDPAADWRKMIDAIDAAVMMGIAPSDVEVREILAPLSDQLPELELPANFQRALEAVDAYLAKREAEDAVTEPARARSVAPEVTEAASLLEGRVLVLIGGEVRLQAKRALERDLRLAELRWIPAAHHQSHYMFESAVARPDIAVVMLAIRWASHSFENVDELCRKYGKPYVRLPGGYSPNQVAKQILEQVGATLRRQYGRATVGEAT